MNRTVGSCKRVATTILLSTLTGWIPVVVLAMASPVAAAEVPEAAKQMIISMPGKNVNYLPLYVALDKGFFKEEGVETVVPVVMRCNVAVSGLIAGNVDYSACSGSSLRGAIRGAPLKVIVWFQNKMAMFLMSKPEIRSGKDLIGKRVAIGSLGASDDYAAKIALKNLGLDPDKDVIRIALGEGNLRLAALQTDSVEAVIVSPPLDAMARAKGFRELIFVGDYEPLPFSGIATTDRKLKEQPAQVKQLLRAVLKGTRFILQQREATVAHLMREWQLNREVAEGTYGSIVKAMSRDGGASEEGMRRTIRMDSEAQKMKEDIPIARVYHDTLLREVQRELGL